MGLTQKLGTIPLAISTDTSNNVGIGGSPSGSYKLEVTGTAKVSGAAYFGTASGSVGIGTTTTDKKLSVKDSTAVQALFFGYTNLGSLVDNESGEIQLGSNNTYAGRIAFSSAGSTTLSIDSTYNGNASVIQFRTKTNATAVTAMTILGSGNVGIGTSSPGDLLHLYKSGTVYQKIETVSGGAGIIYKRQNSTTTDWIVGHGAASANENFETYTAGTGACVWTMNGSERMRIDNNGRLSIGSSSYGAATIKIMAYQTADQHVISSYATTGNANACFFARVDSTTNVFNFFSYGATIIGSINTSAGTSVNYNTTYSDKRLKKNFENWDESVINLFKDINPQKFNLNNQQDSDEKIKGFIAQEMVDKFPEAYPIDNDGFYCFNPSGMVVYLTKAIQEMNTKLDAQNQTIQSLQEQINILAK